MRPEFRRLAATFVRPMPSRLAARDRGRRGAVEPISRLFRRLGGAERRGLFGLAMSSAAHTVLAAILIVTSFGLLSARSDPDEPDPSPPAKLVFLMTPGPGGGGGGGGLKIPRPVRQAQRRAPAPRPISSPVPEVRPPAPPPEPRPEPLPPPPAPPAPVVQAPVVPVPSDPVEARGVPAAAEPRRATRGGAQAAAQAPARAPVSAREQAAGSGRDLAAARAVVHIGPVPASIRPRSFVSRRRRTPTMRDAAGSKAKSSSRS